MDSCPLKPQGQDSINITFYRILFIYLVHNFKYGSNNQWYPFFQPKKKKMISFLLIKMKETYHIHYNKSDFFQGSKPLKKSIKNPPDV